MDNTVSKLMQLIKSRKHKNSKLTYYLQNIIRWYLIPRLVSRAWRRYHLNKFDKLGKAEQNSILERVNYYNKLSDLKKPLTEKGEDGTELVPVHRLKPGAILSNRRVGSMYFFDTYEYMRYFKSDSYASFLFGDITFVPEVPSFVKSRPIGNNNANSVLLNLDKNRHFTFVKDKRNFRDKKDILIGRAFVDQPHRIKFWEMYFGHPMCDLGNINKRLGTHPEWSVKPIAIDDHLDFKFILCLEGNDVASNLKWVMSSNSVAVMPRPVYETWFMEAKLIPDFHYIEIKPDFTDLIEKLNHFIAHPEKCEQIIQNAHNYIKQFQYPAKERLIHLMVIEKYFQKVKFYSDILLNH